MKKLNLLVLPLMAISFLTNCGGGGGPTPTEDVEFTTQSEVTLDRDNKKAIISLNWKPSDHSIECSDFTFTLNNQSDITSNITLGELGSRPLKVTIDFTKALEANDKGDLKFKYNDKTAKKEGEGKVTGINVKLHENPPTPGTYTISMETEGVTITPEELPTDKAYEGTISVTAEGKILDGLTLVTLKDSNTDITQYCTYDPAQDNKSASLEIPLEYLTNDIEVTVALTDEPEPPGPTGTWTLALDDTSKGFGDLKFKDQTADSVTIDEYIGETSAFTMTFVPAQDYKTTQFTITADDTDVTVEDYLPPQSQSGEGSFSIQKTDGFADGDVITLHFVEPVPPVTEYSISMKTEGTTITPTTMNVGEAYNGTITVTNDSKILDGDESLKSVKFKTSGEDITSYCTDYDLSPDYKSATFTIPAEYITDDIEVEVSLTDKPTETATVIWYDENGIDILDTDTDVPVGQHPQYDGNTPYKAKDTSDVYLFSGWDPDATTYVVKAGVNSLKAKYDPVPLTELRAEMKIVIPETSEDLTFNFSHNSPKKIAVEWGDETVDSNNSHTYTKSGTYNISIYGENITGIGAGLGAYDTSKEYLTEVELKEGITTINTINNNTDFERCTNLTSVSVPSTITSVGQFAFNLCDKLVYEIYDDCKYLGNDNNKYKALIGPCDKSITKTNINNKCTVIKDAAFISCNHLTSVTIPEGVVSIPLYTFSSCGELLNVSIPDSVSSIGSKSFYLCSKLLSVNLGNSSTLKTIEVQAFDSCTNLESIVIPASVTKICRFAFYKVEKLMEVDLSGFDVQEYKDLPILETNGFYKYPDNAVFYVKNIYMQNLFANDDVHGWNQIDGSLYKVKPSANNL